MTSKDPDSLGKALKEVVPVREARSEFCLNCRRDREKADTAYHSAPCGKCGSDGHSSCQH